MCCAFQRLAQARAKSEPDESVDTLGAIATNSRTKILMSGLTHDDADFMVKLMHSGFVDLSEWKPGARPVAVGQDRTTLRTTSRGEQHTRQNSAAHSRSRSHADAAGTMTGTSEACGSSSGRADMSSQLMTPHLTLFNPNPNGHVMFPMLMSQTVGRNASRATSQQSARTHATSRMSSCSYAEGDSVGHAESRGTSESVAEGEALATRYEWMPQSQYTLADQLHRLAGAAMNLPHRHAYVKIGNARPILTKTADLPRSFRSEQFRRTMMPVYLKSIAVRSPYIRPVAEVDALTARTTTSPRDRQRVPDAEFTTPQSLPGIESPQDFADGFASRKARRSKRKSPPGRRPVGESLNVEHDKFRVVDGGGDKPDVDPPSETVE